jgi:hypothetical protein
MFWNALWNSDHAVSYLAQKHLAAKSRRHWESVPRWLRIVGGVLLSILVLFVFLSSAVASASSGRPVQWALFPLLILVSYGFFFCGAYRVWNISSVLSALKNSGSMTTVLSTGVSDAAFVDVLAARCFREMVKWFATPFFLLILMMATTEDLKQVLVFLVMMPLMLSFYGLVAAFGILVIHIGSGSLGSRGVGEGMGLVILNCYLPGVLLFPASVLPESLVFIPGIIGGVWVLCMPLIFRRLAVKGMTKKPRVKTVRAKRSLRQLLTSVPSLSLGKSAYRLADGNPVLARALSSQNLLLPLLVLAFFGFAGESMASSLASSGEPWMEAHLVTFMFSIVASVVSFNSTYWIVESEKQMRTLDALRSTPLKASAVVDGWAIRACWVPVMFGLIGVGVLVPTQYLAGSLGFALTLVVASAYAGQCSGMRDSMGVWTTRVAGVILGAMWVFYPLAFMLGFVQVYAVAALLIAVVGWFLRKRMLMAYG